MGHPLLRKTPVMQGELFCRIGYPFLGHSKMDYGPDDFYAKNKFQIPHFVNGALANRFTRLKSGTWTETSSPGLKGQSGGTLLDVAGCVCGMQVNTQSYPLDFEGVGKDQFLNVGRAIDVTTLRNCVNSNSIRYSEDPN